jgi:hypothetical protein
MFFQGKRGKLPKTEVYIDTEKMRAYYKYEDMVLKTRLRGAL